MHVAGRGRASARGRGAFKGPGGGPRGDAAGRARAQGRSWPRKPRPRPAPARASSDHCWAAGGTPGAARGGGSAPAAARDLPRRASRKRQAPRPHFSGVRGRDAVPGRGRPARAGHFLPLAPRGRPASGPAQPAADPAPPRPLHAPREPGRPRAHVLSSPPAGSALRPGGCPGKLGRGAPGMRHHHVPPELVAG